MRNKMKRVLLCTVFAAMTVGGSRRPHHRAPHTRGYILSKRGGWKCRMKEEKVMDLIFRFLINKFIRIKFISDEEINIQLFDGEKIKDINYIPQNKTVETIDNIKKRCDIREYHDGNEIIISAVELPDDKVIIVINNSNKNLFEFEILQKISGTSYSVRIDQSNSSTSTQRHAHIFDSKGNDIYQVNEDGTAHHKRSKGCRIHKEIAEYLNSNGFNIRNDRYISFVNIYDYDKDYIIYKLKQKQIIMEEKNDT